MSVNCLIQTSKWENKTLITEDIEVEYAEQFLLIEQVEDSNYQNSEWGKSMNDFQLHTPTQVVDFPLRTSSTISSLSLWRHLSLNIEMYQTYPHFLIFGVFLTLMQGNKLNALSAKSYFLRSSLSVETLMKEKNLVFTRNTTSVIEKN